MQYKVMISTGGTGGHVYPAMALAQQLLDKMPNCEVLFVGGALDKNKYFDRSQFKYQSVPSATIKSKSPLALLKSFYQICRGMWLSRSIIKKFKPDVVIGFGSHFAFPPLLAAKLMRVPVILHEQNSIPGQVTRFLSRWVKVVGVHFPETISLLKGKIVEVGLPLRKGFQRMEGTQETARKYFGLSSTKSTLLVFGGSQGAQVMNGLVRDAVGQLVEKDFFQIIHLTGNEQMLHELNVYYKNLRVEACVKAFEINMQLAWQAADIVVGRAGAGTIAEQLEFEVPGILIPYPYAMHNHQEHNADFMVQTVGGAVKFKQDELNAHTLANSLRELMNKDKVRWQKMQQAMHAYKIQSRTTDLYVLIKQQLGN